MFEETSILTTGAIIDVALLHDDMLNNYNYDNITRDDMLEDLIKLREYATLQPNEYKELKSIFLHEDVNNAGIITDVFNRGYKRDSVVFNTILRCNNDLRINSDTIKKIKFNEVPPAFDDDLLSESVDVKYLLDLISSRKINSVNTLIDALRREFDSPIDDDGYDMILTNGSTTGIQDEGINLLDINSIAYDAPKWFKDEFGYLISELGINNFNRELLDCPLDSDSIIAGEILHIPDKEFKIRSIYRMFWFVQLVSKRIHVKLDRVAKRIPGNFTYDHKKWLFDLVKNNYNNTKYILTTDMSKYSDTLLNDLIFGILDIAIRDKEMVRQMKRLYTLPVLDTANGIIYERPNGTYQGQYGDFPLITIVNCILQRIVYYLSGQKMRKGYLAAVGDDTGFVFDTYDDRLMDTVIDVYGKAGVQINISKTHELIFGSGFGDFVKLEICGKGIINFFNISNGYKNNVDGFIREIYDSYLINKNEDLMKLSFIKTFGEEIGYHLYNLSFINGGVQWRNISTRDVDLFKRRLSIIKTLSDKNVDDLMIWFDDYVSTLNDNSIRLINTPFIGWSDSEGYKDWSMNTQSHNMDEYIKGKLFNTNLLGHDPRFSKININDLCKLDVPAVKIALDNDQDIDEYTYTLLELINSYESKEALRRRRSNVKNISSYLTTYTLTLTTGSLPNYIPTGIYLKDNKSYQLVKDLKRRRENQSYIGLLDGVYIDGPYWGNYYKRWLYNGIIYDIDNLSNSKYPRPSEKEWCEVTGTDAEFYRDMIYGV